MIRLPNAHLIASLTISGVEVARANSDALARRHEAWGDRMVPHDVDMKKRRKAKAARKARRKGRR